MKAKNDPSAHSLFQDALLDQTAKLGIVRARFEGFDKSSFDELISGYSSMKEPVRRMIERAGAM